MFSFGMIRINQAYIFRRNSKQNKRIFPHLELRKVYIFLQSCRLDEGFKTKVVVSKSCDGE